MKIIIDCRIGYRRQKWGVFILSLVVSWSMIIVLKQFKPQANLILYLLIQDFFRIFYRLKYLLFFSAYNQVSSNHDTNR